MGALHHSRRRTRSGLTLIETVVATALLVLGLASFLSALATIRRVSVAADRRMEAMHRAREVLEAVVTQPYGSSALNLGKHSLSDASYVVSLMSGFATTKSIVVTVPWQAPNGATHQIELRTAVASCLH